MRRSLRPFAKAAGSARRRLINLCMIHKQKAGIPMNHKRPTMLMILDGFGLNPSTYGNAVAAASTPKPGRAFRQIPAHSACRKRSGRRAAGGSDGQLRGRSPQYRRRTHRLSGCTRITKAIDDGIFFDNIPLNHAMQHVKETDGTLHVFGLLSDGGVHSHIAHIEAVLKLAKMRGLQKVVVHCFMDGRDVPPTSGLGFVQTLEAYLTRLDFRKNRRRFRSLLCHGPRQALGSCAACLRCPDTRQLQAGG